MKRLAKKSVKAVICAYVFVLALIIPLQAYSISDADSLIALGVQPAVARKIVQIVNTLASPFSNNTWVTVRNAANSANINVLKVDGSDETILNADSGDKVNFAVGGTVEAHIDNDQLTFTGAAAQIVPGATSLSIRNNADAVDNVLIADAGTLTTAAGITATTGNITSTAGSFVAAASGQTLHLQEATAGAKCMGQATANGTTAVTVATTCATTGARVFLTRDAAPSGTAQCWATNIVNGTSFDLDCSGAETGTFNWFIIKEAA